MTSNLADRAGRLLIGGVSWMVLCYLALPLFVVIAISFTTTAYLKLPAGRLDPALVLERPRRPDLHRGLCAVGAARGAGDASTRSSSACPRRW